MLSTSFTFFMDFINYYTWVKAFLQWRNFKIVSSTTVLLSHHLNWFIRSVNLNWFIRSINSFSIPSPTPPAVRHLSPSVLTGFPFYHFLIFPDIPPPWLLYFSPGFLPRFSPQVSPCKKMFFPCCDTTVRPPLLWSDHFRNEQGTETKTTRLNSRNPIE